MRSATYLRIAAVLTFLHALLHTVGGVFGKPVPGPATNVAAVMHATRFPVFGVTRSYEDFYFGLGLAVSIALTVGAIGLWQLSILAKRDAMSLRPLLATLAIGCLALAINSQLYFFIAPVIVELLMAACLVLAIWTAKPAQHAAPVVQR